MKIPSQNHRLNFHRGTSLHFANLNRFAMLYASFRSAPLGEEYFVAKPAPQIFFGRLASFR